MNKSKDELDGRGSSDAVFWGNFWFSKATTSVEGYLNAARLICDKQDFKGGAEEIIAIAQILATERASLNRDRAQERWDLHVEHVTWCLGEISRGVRDKAAPATREISTSLPKGWVKGVSNGQS